MASLKHLGNQFKSNALQIIHRHQMSEQHQNFDLTCFNTKCQCDLRKRSCPLNLCRKIK